LYGDFLDSKANNDGSGREITLAVLILADFHAQSMLRQSRQGAQMF